ncbi:hypothetical protein ACHAWF_014975 [Thalassiosira exigua]
MPAERRQPWSTRTRTRVRAAATASDVEHRHRFGERGPSTAIARREENTRNIPGWASRKDPTFREVLEETATKEATSSKEGTRAGTRTSRGGTRGCPRRRSTALASAERRRSLPRAAAAAFVVAAVAAFVLLVPLVRYGCRPPPPTFGGDRNRRRLVEYHVHGRGRGHAARSYAVAVALNDAGVDVRMYTWSAEAGAVWDASSRTATADAGPAVERRGRTTYHVTRPFPRRLAKACGASRAGPSVPDLIVTDADVPGALWSFLTGVPCLSMSHGQTFVVASKPSYVASDPDLSEAWDGQRALNARNSWGCRWRVGTSFIPLETAGAGDAVAAPPLRKEMTMRDHREALGLEVVLTPLRNGARQRKVVACYFRDRNGGRVEEVLLAQGFDVLAFDPAGRESRDLSEVHAPTDEGDDGEVQDDNAPRIHVIRDASLLGKILPLVDGVVSSGGSQLISECMYVGVPLFALFREGDTEQLLNVEMMKRRYRNGHGVSIEAFLEVFDRGNMRKEKLWGKESGIYDDFASFASKVGAFGVSRAPLGETSAREMSKEDPFGSMIDASNYVLEILDTLAQLGTHKNARIV